VKVEIFYSPGCARCGKAKDLLRKIAADIGGGRIALREVSVLEELDYAVSLGVLSTPAIAVDGKLAFTSLPPSGRLRAMLEQKLRETETPGAATRLES
jgi:thioredoxin-like negative regulator of GroEL